MVICLEQGADLHMVQPMPLPLTVSCFSKIQIGFIFLVPAHPGSPGKRAVKRARARACVCVSNETKAIEYLTVEVDEPVGDGGVRQLTDVDLRPVEHLAVERAACYRLVEIENLDHVLTCIRCTTQPAGATALRDPSDAYAPT